MSPSTAAASWKPTRKWLGLLVTTVAGILIVGVQQGWDTSVFRVSCITGVANLLVTYLVPNQAFSTGTGVPERLSTLVPRAPI